MKRISILFGFSIILGSCVDNEKKNEHLNLTSIDEKKDSIIDSSAYYDSVNVDFIPRIQAFFETKFRQRHFNGAYLFADHGYVITKGCFGIKNKQTKDSIQLNTSFQLASVSKTFTAIATLKLVEQKKLSLKDSVQKFYPNFPFHEVTIEQLLSHRSGLPNYIYSFNDSSKVAKRPTNQIIMKWFEKTAIERYSAPGVSFSYNNSNYAVLAALIEKVSGLSYTHYLEQNIFRPLNMNQTFVINSIPDSLSKTVGHDRKRRIKKDFNDDVLGDKGIYSSIDDLLKWYKCLINGKLLSPEHMKLAFSPKSFEHPGIRNYGFGFRMILDKETQEPTYIYHNGWWKGYSTLFWFDPKTESFITILSNERNKAIYKTTDIISILEGEKSPHL